MKTKLTKAQQRVVDCLIRGGRVLLKDSGTVFDHDTVTAYPKKGKKFKVSLATIDALEDADIIYMGSDDGAGSYYLTRHYLDSFVDSLPSKFKFGIYVEFDAPGIDAQDAWNRLFHVPVEDSIAQRLLVIGNKNGRGVELSRLTVLTSSKI